MSGATINGSIVAPGGAAHGASTDSGTGSPAFVPPGLTVSAVGTNVSAPVDPAGQFALRGLPAGNVQLQFTAPGVSASVSVSSLQNGETVTITVSLTATTAAVESERRASGAEVQLEGLVESLPPDTDAGTFELAGQLVATNESTKFFYQGGPVGFDALAVGFRVHVKGQMAGGSLLASVVMLQSPGAARVNINGIIENFSGTPAAFQFEVDGILINGDLLTEFFGNTVFADLADGQTVEVKGLQKDGFVYATRIHVESEEIEFTGVILAPIAGTAPDLTFAVDSTTDREVTTTALTVVRRKSDTQSPAALQVGMTIAVTGKLLPDGSVIARRINIEGDAVGGEFQMTGPVGGLSGACPTRSFSINGFAIVTDLATVYAPAAPGCTGLANGGVVKVEGIVQIGGTVLATTITK
jgi:hypothetical protein